MFQFKETVKLCFLVEIDPETYPFSLYRGFWLINLKKHPIFLTPDSEYEFKSKFINPLYYEWKPNYNLFNVFESFIKYFENPFNMIQDWDDIFCNKRDMKLEEIEKMIE